MPPGKSTGQGRGDSPGYSGDTSTGGGAKKVSVMWVGSSLEGAKIRKRGTRKGSARLPSTPCSAKMNEMDQKRRQDCVSVRGRVK